MNTALDLCAKSWRKLVQNGPLETARIIKQNVHVLAYRREEQNFDQRHNVDTSGRVDPSEQHVHSANRQHGVRYEATPRRLFAGVMSNLPPGLGEYTFVDFGSGKGRALLLASHYGFKRIIGVEYDSDLHVTALENLKRYGAEGRQCLDIVSINIDACDFKLPLTPCVCYFYQPFDSAVMQNVIDNLLRSLAEHPRHIVLLWLLPHRGVDETISRMGKFRRITVRPLPMDFAWQYERKLSAYESV